MYELLSVIGKKFWAELERIKTPRWLVQWYMREVQPQIEILRVVLGKTGEIEVTERDGGIQQTVGERTEMRHRLETE